jgi:hypothetical protein
MFTFKVIQFEVSIGQTPRLETVKQRVEWLLPYGLNGVLLYMESVVPNKTFPVVRKDPPISQAYLRELNAYCSSKSVHLIPLFQTLAHQDTLLRLDEFQHLGELPPPENKQKANNFLPWHPEVRQKVAAWLDELLPIFDSPLVHLGQDEAWNIGTGRSREIIAKQGLEPVLADYLSFLNEVVKRHGKRMLIYADSFADFPKLLKLTPRDITPVNWHYGTPDGCYEADNHHFAYHDQLHRYGHTVWGSGNNVAEYQLMPFHGLEKNITHWLRLCGRYHDEGFLISDWFARTTRVAPLLGEQYILMKMQNPRLTLEGFLKTFSSDLLGRVDRAFVDGLALLVQANWHPRYFGRRLTYFGPLMRELMTEDPASGGWLGRRFGALTVDKLDKLLADMRKGEALLKKVKPRSGAHVDLLEECRMLAGRWVMTALRARLWYEYAWDTALPCPLPERDRPRTAWLGEYLQRANADLAWARGCWAKDSADPEPVEARERLEKARDAMPRLFPYSVVKGV